MPGIVVHIVMAEVQVYSISAILVECNFSIDQLHSHLQSGIGLLLNTIDLV